MTDKVINFEKAGEKLRHEKAHQKKEEKIENMRERFAQALPERKTPVKDYLRKKRLKKKK